MKRLALLLLVLPACEGIDMGATTAPYAHESPSDTGSPVVPTLRFFQRSAFLGGSADDAVDDVALGDDGTVYVVGGTASADFPTTDGSTLDPSTPAGCSACPFDGFVAAIAPDGSPRWTRLIGTAGYDRVTSIERFGQRLFVAGETGQRGAVAGWHGGADPTGQRGEQDGFVCEIDPADGAPIACRYVGGSGPGGVSDLTFGFDGTEVAIVVAMSTTAAEAIDQDPDYSPAFLGRHRATAAGSDVAVIGLDSDLTPGFAGVHWATYVGGTGDEGRTPSVMFDADGSNPASWYVLMETTSTDAPVPGGIQTVRPADGNSAYLAVLNADGTGLRYGTYLGGNGEDRVGPRSIVDVGGSTYVGITTGSLDMPAVGPGPQPQHGGNGGPGCGDGDIWLMRFEDQSSGGFNLTAVGSRYLGGSAGERLGGMSWASTGAGLGIVIAGSTFSTNFPTPWAAQAMLAGTPCAQSPGNADAFAAEVDADLVSRNATYLGGAMMDRGLAIARGATGLTTVVGQTASSDFPTLAPGDLTFGGATDGFVTRFIGAGPPPTDGGVDGPIDGPDDGPSGPEAMPGDYVFPESTANDGCCGVGADPAASAAPALLVLALILARRRRRS